MINWRPHHKIITNTVLFILLSLMNIACSESQYNDEQNKLLSKYQYGIENRGKLYFQQVCSDCHQNSHGIRIPPQQNTMAQWHKYLNDNRHQINGDTHALARFFTKEYRAKLAKNNENIELVIDVSNKELLLDLAKYLINGAKDADSPKSCSQ